MSYEEEDTCMSPAPRRILAYHMRKRYMHLDMHLGVQPCHRAPRVACHPLPRRVCSPPRGTQEKFLNFFFASAREKNKRGKHLARTSGASERCKTKRPTVVSKETYYSVKRDLL